MTSKSASTTRRATPATRPTAKAEAGSRPPTTVSDAVSAVAGLDGSSTNATQSPGSPSVARIGGSGTILSFARARSLQRTVGNNATAAVMGAGSGIDRLNTAPLASQSKGSPRQPLSRAVAVGSMPQVQRAFFDFLKNNREITERKLAKTNKLLIDANANILPLLPDSAQFPKPLALELTEYTNIYTEASSASGAIREKLKDARKVEENTVADATKAKVVAKEALKQSEIVLQGYEGSTWAGKEEVASADNSLLGVDLKAKMTPLRKVKGIIAEAPENEEFSEKDSDAIEIAKTTAKVVGASGTATAGGLAIAGRDVLSKSSQAHDVEGLKDASGETAKSGLPQHILGTLAQSASALYSVYNLYTLINSDKEVPGKAKKLGMFRAVTGVVRSSLSVVNEWMTNNPWTAQVIPGLNIVVAGLSLVETILNYLNDKENKEFFDRKGAEKIIKDQDNKQIAPNYEKMSEIFNKRMNRGIVNGIGQVLTIAGEVTKLAGAATGGAAVVAGAVVSGVGSAVPVLAYAARSTKQWYRDKGYGDQTKTTDEKRKQYDEIINMYINEVKIVDENKPEALKELFEELERNRYPIEVMAQAVDYEALFRGFRDRLRQR